MGLSLITAPASEPITLVEAKAHLRVDISDDDTLINSAITGARQWAEGITRRGFVAQTWDYTLAAFPAWEIALPLQPVSSVSYVHYVTEAGVTTSFASSASPEVPKWTLTTDGPRAMVFPNYNLEWPATRNHGNAITIRFVVGYTTMPEDIKKALLLLVAHQYEMREPYVVGQGTMVSPVPLTVDALLSPYMLRGF